MGEGLPFGRMSNALELGWRLKYFIALSPGHLSVNFAVPINKGNFALIDPSETSLQVLSGVWQSSADAALLHLSVTGDERVSGSGGQLCPASSLCSGRMAGNPRSGTTTQSSGDRAFR